MEVKPRYSQPACAIDKMVHIINQLPLRTIVLDPHCPYVSKVVSPGNIKTNKDSKEHRVLKNVVSVNFQTKMVLHRTTIANCAVQENGPTN